MPTKKTRTKKPPKPCLPPLGLPMLDGAGPHQALYVASPHEVLRAELAASLIVNALRAKPETKILVFVSESQAETLSKALDRTGLPGWQWSVLFADRRRRKHVASDFVIALDVRPPAGLRAPVVLIKHSDKRDPMRVNRDPREGAWRLSGDRRFGFGVGAAAMVLESPLSRTATSAKYFDARGYFIDGRILRRDPRSREVSETSLNMPSPESWTALSDRLFADCPPSRRPRHPLPPKRRHHEALV